MRHLRYLSYVLRHRCFVFVEACRLGIPWLGLVHDLSKFSPDEWMPYANFFYGPKRKPVRDATGYYKPTDTGDQAFDYSWLLHQKRNRHHWQWWLLPEDDGGIKRLEMPLRYRKEMLADWRGAGKAQGYGDNTLAWYTKNRHKMILAPLSRMWIEREIGYAEPHTCRLCRHWHWPRDPGFNQEYGECLAREYCASSPDFGESCDLWEVAS